MYSLLYESTQSICERVVSRWKNAGIRVRQPCAVGTLDAFEKKNGICLPEGIRLLYATADGMDNGDWDEHMIRFLPLSEVYDIGYDPMCGIMNTYVFADYSVSAHLYAVVLCESSYGQVRLIGGSAPLVIATTFREFLELYLSNPQRLF